MKKYISPEGWKVIPPGRFIPELFVSPEGIIYKRKQSHETIDVSVQTKYGLVELRRWYGSPQERRTSRSIKQTKKFNRRKRPKKKK